MLHIVQHEVLTIKFHANLSATWCRFLRTVSITMAERIMSGVMECVVNCLCDLLVDKSFTLAWAEQKIFDAYHLCMTMWKMSQPHVIYGMVSIAQSYTEPWVETSLDSLHVPADHCGSSLLVQESCLDGGTLSAACRKMALLVNLQTCSTAEFLWLARNKVCLEIRAQTHTQAGDDGFQTESSGTTAWAWFKVKEVQQLDLMIDQAPFFDLGVYENAKVLEEWRNLQQGLMDIARPLDIVNALPARPDLVATVLDTQDHSACVQAIRDLVQRWPTFAAFNHRQSAGKVQPAK